MTQKERMLAGQLYLASDEQLRSEFKRARRLARVYNATTEEEPEVRERLLKEMFRSVGKNVVIEPPIQCDYGINTTLGDCFYANYECIILDVCEVRIGNHVMFGPRVSVFAACHPIDAGVRDSLLELGKPVTIGNSVWVGGNTVINPSVTIGDNVVIGSGSVVTKDIPSNVVAAGNPCRVIREITPRDREFWETESRAFFEERK